MSTPVESPQSFDFGSLSLNNKETEEKEPGATGHCDIKELPRGEYLELKEQTSALTFSVTPTSSQLQLGEQKAESSEDHVLPGEPLGKQNGSFLDSGVDSQFPTLIRSFQVVTASVT